MFLHACRMVVKPIRIRIYNVRFMNSKVIPCWIFVNAVKQSNLLVNCNNSIPFFLLYRRQPFLTPFCFEKQAILGYEALTFLSIRLSASLPSFDSTTSRGQIRCLLSLLSRKRTMSLYSFTSIRYGGHE